MNQDVIWQLVRYFLLIAGGAAVARGWITDEQLALVVGAVGTVFVTAWGVYVKWGSSAVPAATAARTDVPTVSPVTGAKIPGNS